VHELFKYLLLDLGLQLALFDFINFLNCPIDEFLDLLPTMLHRFRVEDNYDKLEVIFLDGSG
jgi:hypothetical protein